MNPVHPMLSLSDDQLRRVVKAAKQLDVDKRGVFLTRLGENLKRAPENMTADEFERALAVSLKGLVQPAQAETAAEVWRRTAGDPRFVEEPANGQAFTILGARRLQAKS
jgi:hypothetical protein